MMNTNLFRLSLPLLFSLLPIGIVLAQAEGEKENAPTKIYGTDSFESENLKPPDGTSKSAIELHDEGVALFEKAKTEPQRALALLKEAISRWKRAMVLAPNFSLPLYRQGIAYQWTREYDDARQVLERAIKINPKFYEAIVELGDTYEWMRHHEKALAEYDRALAIKPDYPIAMRNKAIVYLKLRQVNKAKECISEATHELNDDILTKSLLEMIDLEVRGPGWAKTFEKESDHFHIYTDVSEEYAQFLSENAERIYAIYTQIFPKIEKRDMRFPIFVFNNPQDYFKWGGPPGSGGFYTPFAKKLSFFKQPNDENTLIVLYHEGFHQFLDYYVEDAPSWFNEGHADYFGALVYDAKKNKMLTRPNPWRLPAIQQAIKSGRARPLSELLRMTQAELYDPGTIGMNYAQSWSFIYFLWIAENGKYRNLVRSYFKAMQQGYGIEKAYDAVFGKINMEKLDKEWREFTLSLKVESPEK